MSVLTDLARGLPAYADLREKLRGGESRLTLAGGVGALPGLLLAALAEDLGRPLSIVVPNEKEAERLRCDLEAAGLTRVFHAPAPTLTPYQRIPASLKARRDEFALLSALAEPGAVEAAVLPARSLFARLPARQEFDRLRVTLAEGEEVSLPALIARLTRIGYRRDDLVVETGDLAVRGGLFDAFPPDRELPVRVELDGDRIASIRVFDPDTQRSRDRLPRVTLPPFAAAEESEELREDDNRIGRPPSGRAVGFAPQFPPAVAGSSRRGRADDQAGHRGDRGFEERLAGTAIPTATSSFPGAVSSAARIAKVLSRAVLQLDQLGLSAGRGRLLRVPAEAIAGHSGRTAEAAAGLSVARGGRGSLCRGAPAGGAGAEAVSPSLRIHVSSSAARRPHRHSGGYPPQAFACARPASRSAPGESSARRNGHRPPAAGPRRPSSRTCAT
jgi:hypothetical protein